MNCHARTLVGGADSPNVALEQWEQCGYTIHPVGREKVNCRAAAREAGLGHDSARRMCQFITGRKCRCARRAHYDSLRAAAKRRLLACTLAAAREEGALRPLLRITPAERCSRVPATANKFVHILWKNLICDNVATVAFFRLTPGAEVLAIEACVCCFREGDAPAGCRYAGAQCAPLRVTDAVFSAPGSWPRMARRVVAPYDVAAVNGTRTVLRWQPIPCLSQWQPGGNRKALLTFARAARPEGRGGDSQEAGGTLVPPPLVRLSRAATPFPPPAGGEISRP